MQQMDEIDDFKREYVDDMEQDDTNFNPIDPAKKKEEFRNYANSARQQRVEKFYREQHEKMTYAYVQSQRERHLKLDKAEMGIWEALEYLNTVIDDSDPDTNLTQMAHALQTAEAIRKDYPDEAYDWFHLVGLIHDLGKILAVTDPSRNLKGDEQWTVVGDSFPVGCGFDGASNIFPQYFENNPDFLNSAYNTRNGVYASGCGLSNVTFSWGHDEYIYCVMVMNKCTVPLEVLYMLRFHSFYPWHKQGGYQHLMDDQDHKMLEWVQKFNKYDLYSKADDLNITDETLQYYKNVIKKYCPEKLKW